MPSVSELQIHEHILTFTEANAVFDTRIIEQLTINHQQSFKTSNPILLPLLRTLSLLGGLRFDPRVFTAMIKSRTIDTSTRPSTFHNIFVQLEQEHDRESALSRFTDTYEPPLTVQVFKEVQDILRERAHIAAVQFASPNLAFPRIL